jgi:hypothetical protein
MREFFICGDGTMTKITMAMVAAGLCWLAGANAHAQGEPDYEQPPVRYSATQPNDAIARLQQKLASGELAFAGSDREVLQTLLRTLDVPVESQLLVFSRTSLQRGRIRPERPRALYFSDSMYVGWVPGGLIEVAAIDPKLGPVFYTFAPSRAAHGGAPDIQRDADCLRCHGGTFVRDIPGVFARSVFPDSNGEPLLRHGTLIVDDETPFAQRWGGWYVTGYHGTESHRGNTRGSELADQLVFESEKARPDELSAYFETGDYLRPTSDVVALLVFEHQLTMQNALTRAGMVCRKMIAYQHGLQKAFKEPVTDEPAFDSVKSVFASAVQDVVDRLLFRNAAPLPSGVVGDRAFQEAFLRDRSRDAAGRSLRDLQLHDRMFQHRCSYLIYSEAFRALPEMLKVRVMERLRAALQSRDAKDRYAYLAADEKQRIYEILLATLPEAKAQWAEQGSAQREKVTAVEARAPNGTDTVTARPNLP